MATVADLELEFWVETSLDQFSLATTL